MRCPNAGGAASGDVKKCNRKVKVFFINYLREVRPAGL
jgi:hypothetical protein